MDAVEINNLDFAGSCSKKGLKRMWSHEFRDCAALIKDRAAKADYSNKTCLDARREFYLARALARKVSQPQ